MTIPMVYNQLISLDNSNVSLQIKREDLIHQFISGNKFRKLKYNIEAAQLQKARQLLTFGGAFSNHIAAVAFAGKTYHFETIGIIRGDEIENHEELNPTLQFAKDCGMQFEFVTRSDYRLKESEAFIESLNHKFGDFYLIPEGGTNDLAIKGCEEILTEDDSDFDYICCSIGTGGTFLGICNSLKPNQKLLGFPALKGDFIENQMKEKAKNDQWKIISEYHFGGYGKVTPDLIDFINQFKADYKVPLDPIYTGKMVYGVMDLIRNNYFKVGTKILLIHTGGLQGIQGMNNSLKHKKWTLIN